MRYFILFCLLSAVLGEAAYPNERPVPIKAVTVYYMDPWTNAGLPVSVDALIKSSENGEFGTAKIQIDGSWALFELSEAFARQLREVPTDYWLRNSIDARVIVRLWIDSKTYIQLAVQSKEKAEWNNIMGGKITAEDIKAALSVLPRVLFESIYNADFAIKRIERMGPPK